MAVNPSGIGGVKPQFELSTGLPNVGGQLFFYVAGSVGTKQNTYTDSTGGSANPNPIVLNSLGMPTNEIWWTSGLLYKVVYAPATDTDPPTSPIWTVDNVPSSSSATTTIDQWIAGPAPTYIGATSFSLVGDQTSTFTVGRRLKTTNTSGTIYSTIITAVFGAITTVTVRNDSGTLDSGLSAVSYGLVSASNTSLPAGATPGTATNNSAAAGFVGEYVESIIGVTNFPATTVFGDLTSISLTAGDWDVTGAFAASLNGATCASVTLGVSTTTGNSTAGTTSGSNIFSTLPPTANYNVPIAVPAYRISLAATTTIYLKYEAVFSAGTPQASGRLSARRVR